MHDDTQLTVRRVERVLRERIWPGVHARSAPVEVGAHALDGEPIDPADGLALDHEPYQVGTPWGPAWGTTWFRISGTVPQEFAGRRVELVVDLGFDERLTGFQCEGLVYLPDGTPVKSLNPRNQWVLIAQEAVAGTEFTVHVEAASNPILLGDNPFRPTEEGDVRTSSPAPLYVARRIELAVFEEQVHALALDVEVLLELQANLPDGPRRMQILAALDDALDRLDLQHLAETAPSARDALTQVLSAPAEASAHRLSAVGHAHIDSAWLWPVRETIRKVARTSASMVDLIDHTDDFLYGMSSAQQYAWIKEHRPQVWDRVVAAVAAGRFLPLGGQWVESDTVMPSGESLVRQFLYGQRFFGDEFGIRSQGVWLPDSFGYSPALPQLIRRAGFSWFFTQKISWNQVNTFPHHTFEWEGIDGSRVLTHFPPMDTYTAELSGDEVALASRQFRESRRATGSIAPVGWGDGGGGTTREMVGKAQRLADLEGSARVAWEHPDTFFERTRAELPDPPIWVGELYLELHRATLTSQHRTKRGNRQTEHLLVEAELWAATAAARVDLAYPHDELDELWKQVLLLQFHDILPGTSIAWVHREAVAAYERVRSATEEIIDRSLRALLGDGSQELTANGSTVTLDGVRPGEVAVPDRAATSAVLSRTADGLVLENGLVRVVVDDRGLIVSAVDLGTGRDAIAAGQVGNLLQLHQDFPNKWDAWDVDRFYANRVSDVTQLDRLDADVVDGVAQVSLERPLGEASSVRQVIRLEPGSRAVQIDQVTDWHESETFLKVSFGLDVRAEHSVAETQFGHHARVTHTNTSWEAAKFETSMHRFLVLAERGFSVALVNDSTYGYDVTRRRAPIGHTTTARLSLLRAPRFPDPQTDQGEQRHSYALVVGADEAQALTHGVRMNTPARSRTGARGVAPLVEVTGEGVALSAVKQAVDRSGDLIVRVYEHLGGRARGRIQVNGPYADAVTVDLLEEPVTPDEAPDDATVVDLGPFEVRTVRWRRA